MGRVKREKLRSKSWIALFLSALVIVLTWGILRGKINFSAPTSTPTATPDISFKINIPSKALWKNYVVISAEADPGTTCTLTFIPPSGDIKTMETTADADGLCEWRWKIEETAGKGDGRLIFTIDGVSETHFMEIWSGF